MEIKNCQMIVAQDYLQALKQCHVEDNIRISQTTLEEEQLIKQDLARSCFICPTKTFKDLEFIWLNDYKQHEGNEYHQGRIEGSLIPCTKMTQVIMLLNGFFSTIFQTEKISFSYLDDANRWCGFTLIVLIDCPSIWFASVTTNTPEASKSRQVTVLAPLFSRERFENTMQITNKLSKTKKETLYQGLAEIMQLVDPVLLPMHCLSSQIGNALHCHFIEYYLSGLFDEHGFIRLEHFDRLKNAIKNQANMFDFSTPISNSDVYASEKTTTVVARQFTSLFSGDKSSNHKLINQNVRWASQQLHIIQGLTEFVEDIEEKKNLKQQIDAAIFVLDFNLGIKEVIECASNQNGKSAEKIMETFLNHTKKEENKDKLLSCLDSAILDLLNAQCKLGQDLLVMKDKLTSETIVNTMHF